MKLNTLEMGYLYSTCQSRAGQERPDGTGADAGKQAPARQMEMAHILSAHIKKSLTMLARGLL